MFNNNDLAEDAHNHQHTDLRRSILNESFVNSQNVEQNFKERMSKNYKLALKLSRASRLDNSRRGSEIGNSTHNSPIFDEDEKTITMIVENDEKNLKINKIKSEEIPAKKDDSVNINLMEPGLNEKDPIRTQLEEKLLEHQNRLNQNSMNLKNSNQDFQKKEEYQAGHQHHNLVSKDDGFLTCTILLIAMGIHGFFAMMAFGIEQSESGALNLFIALIVHKWSEALTVGMNIYSRI